MDCEYSPVDRLALAQKNLSVRPLMSVQLDIVDAGPVLAGNVAATDSAADSAAAAAAVVVVA